MTVMGGELDTKAIVKPEDFGIDKLMEGREWIDAKVRPPEPGLIVKRWIKPDGFSHWAGYYGGGAKMASCDFWLELPD